MIGNDGSGGSADKDKELDALLSAADSGLLDAIRDNVDLDTGFAQILARRRLRPSSCPLTWSFPLTFTISSALTQGPAVT